MENANKCVVCSAGVRNGVCPVCGFAVVHFPGSFEEGMKLIKPEVVATRMEFLSKVKVFLPIYFWKDQNGVIALDREEKVSLGSGTELYGKRVWLPQRFARLPNRSALSVTLSVTVEQKEYQKTISVPNRMESELQELGMEMVEAMQVKLLLRNQTGCSESGWESLFD